jgi:hypothetical protein
VSPDGPQLGTGLERVRVDAVSDPDGNQGFQRGVTARHPGQVSTAAPEPERCRIASAAGLDQFEVVTNMQGPLLDDPIDDRISAGEPEGQSAVDLRGTLGLFFRSRGFGLVVPGDELDAADGCWR